MKVAEKALNLSNGGQFVLAALGAAYAAAGRHSEARAALDQLYEMSLRTYVSPYHRSLIHLLLGERQPALTAAGSLQHQRWMAGLARS